MGEVTLPDYVYSGEERDGQMVDELVLPYLKLALIITTLDGGRKYPMGQLKSLSIGRTLIMRPLTAAQVQESDHYRALLNQRSST